MLLALLTASACGGVAKSDGPGGGSGSVSVSAEDFPARYAGARCALTERCCSASGGTQLDTCQELEEEKHSLDAARARRAGARFDEEAAESCLADLENRSCEEDALDLLAGSCPIVGARGVVRQSLARRAKSGWIAWRKAMSLSAASKASAARLKRCFSGANAIQKARPCSVQRASRAAMLEA
jgi:hypothetical protein